MLSLRLTPLISKDLTVGSNSSIGNRMLSSFIKYLEKNNLLEFEILESNDSNFENRFKIQKYVFLAKRFGMNLPFAHNMYLYGPYSRELASKYYELAKNRKKMYDTAEPALDKSFRDQHFLELVKDKNTDWLEIATTLISRNGKIDKRADLVENVKDIKDGFSQEYISDVLVDLENTSLVRLAH